MKRWRRLRRLLACTALGLMSGTARAEYRHRVLLLEHAGDDERGREISTRVRGELGAAGFEVVVLRVEDDDPKRAVEAAGRELHPAAVLLVERMNPVGAGKGDATGAELWLADRLLQKTVVLRLKAEEGTGSGAATRIAVQAVELVKARLAELSLTRDTTSPAPPVARRAPLVAETPARGVRPGVTLGLGLLEGFRKGQRAFAPLLHLGITLPERWTGESLAIDLRGELVGLGSAVRIEHGPGAAKLRHTLVGLDTVARFLPRGRVQPFVSLGAGLLLLDISGDAPDPYLNSSSRTRSAVLDAGGGVWLQPLPGFGFTLEGQVLGALSKTVVRIVNEDAAEVGAPLLLLSGGLMLVF
jgi:hypothetical protein